MGEAFPELKSQQAHIERVLKAEEEQFAKTLEQGLKILEQDLAELKGSIVPVTWCSSCMTPTVSRWT